MRKWFVPLCFFLLAAPVSAQVSFCAGDSLNTNWLISNPEYRETWTNAWIQQENFVQQHMPGAEAGPYIIPVVVHVIHYDGAENISDAQIRNGIRVLNRNFRKLNADTTDIVPAFQSIAADMEVEFRLATLDPNGFCTDGINRVRSPLSLTGGHNVKELIHWPRENYLNIYVCREAAGLAGHALMPFQADSLPGWDGIVIAGNSFGDTLTSDPVRSVVLTHEVGHYLNLYHIWGGNNVPGFYYLPVGQPANCSEDDGVMDTPNTIGWSSCNLNGASCGSVQDNVQNYMDYAYCARMFTEGQKTRVHAALNSSVAQRDQLWVPANLDATGVSGIAGLCYADFSVPRHVYCTGQTVSFFDKSASGATSWLWNFGDGNTSSQQHPNYAYTQPGWYNVTLKVSDGIDTLTKFRMQEILILPASSLSTPLSEDFEGGNDIYAAGFFTETENGVFPDLDLTVGYSGNHSVRFYNLDTNQVLRATLTTLPVNLTQITDPAITFRYAYAKKDSTHATDRLVVKVSKNCGQTWIQRLALSDTALTALWDTSGMFLPAFSDWKRGTILNIPASYITDETLIRFEFYSAGGNDLFIDDIQILPEAIVGTHNEKPLQAQLYPNPSPDKLYLQGVATGPYEILNTFGQVVQTGMLAGEGMISVENLLPGFYIFRTPQFSASFLRAE